jgi:hypothetical protein
LFATYFDGIKKQKSNITKVLQKYYISINAIWELLRIMPYFQYCLFKDIELKLFVNCHRIVIVYLLRMEYDTKETSWIKVGGKS